VNDSEVEEYVAVLAEIAESAGGGTVDTPSTVHDCPDHEDNLVPDLAAVVGALLIVSDDTNLTSMSPRCGTPNSPAKAIRFLVSTYAPRQSPVVARPDLPGNARNARDYRVPT
jgi:hypothetical protein